MSWNIDIEVTTLENIDHLTEHMLFLCDYLHMTLNQIRNNTTKDNNITLNQL